MLNREILKNEIKRIEELLPKTDPLRENYGQLLFHLRELHIMTEWTGDDQTNAEPTPELPVNSVKHVDPEEKAPWVEQTPYSYEEHEEPGEHEEPEEHEEKKISFVKDDWTREEVRAVLDEAKNRGTILRPIIEKFVPEGAPVKFSSIPAARYKELVEELNNA